MLRIIHLLLPALIPSWRFFQTIDASPRVQYRVFDATGLASCWRDFEVKPSRLSMSQYIGRLFWNHRRAQALYVVSLAERLIEAPSPHSVAAIRGRIFRNLLGDKCRSGNDLMQFRVMTVSRRNTSLCFDLAFQDDPVPILKPSHEL